MEEISEGDSQINKFCQNEPDECYELLQLEISKKEKPIKQSKDAIFHLPAIVKEIPHRESILRILPTAENGSFMLMGQDGLISFWSSALKIMKSKSLFVQEENRKFKWITDFILINQYNKFVIGTCDREIRIYELSNFEPYCQIIGLDSMPLRLDYSSTGDDEGIILYGDEQGCVNIFLVSMMGECLRNWTKGPTVDGIPSVTIEKLSDSRQISYIRWNVHDDWVTEVKYIHSIKSVISSCNEEDTSLVIGCVRSTKSFQQKMKEIHDAIQNRNSQPQATVTVLQKRLSCDETVFIISKGAKTFDFCEEKNLVVTGGLDKIVRLWNPRLPRRPTGLLQGHNSPIVFLNVDAGACRIFSIAIDKIIKIKDRFTSMCRSLKNIQLLYSPLTHFIIADDVEVKEQSQILCLLVHIIKGKIWDIEDQTCLITVNPTTSKISGDLAACYYSQELKALYIATDSLALLQLRGRQEQSKGVSHKKPVLCCLYNKLMRQIVTGCEGSVVKVWDLNTGSPVLEFTRAHGDAAITCMTFDTSERRLITGSRDGNVKKWNFKNGQCIQTLRQVGNRTEEVSDCIYAEIYKNGFIISVGWDKKINVFPDIQYHCDTQYPSLHWVEEAENGHKDDILSVVLCAANLLATSSYDGEIIIWNFISGLIFCRLHSPVSAPLQQLSDEDLSINKLLCIKSRTSCEKTSATLVSSGPRGCIHFWNIFHGGKLLAHFLCSAHKTTVTSMALSEDSSLLCAADHSGYIYIFHILHYALCGPETHPPESLAHWKAHECSVTSIGLVEEYQLLVTSSVDCTVKLWNVKGEFVGIFGQGEQWNIQRSISEKNQELSIISKELTLQCDTGTNERVKSKSEVALFLLKKKYQEVTNDIEQVDSLMKIRLHEQKLKCIEKQQIYGRLTAYQSLHCHELADISMKIQKPDPAELLPT